MPNIQKEIELAATEFATAMEIKMEASVVNAIMDLQAQGLAKNEIFLALSALDMEDFILNDIGFGADIDNLIARYQTGILANMEMFGSVTEPMLQSLVAMDKATFVKQAGYQANLIKQELGRKILGGATEAEMLSSLKTIVRPDQAKTLVNTSLNTFSRTVNVQMAESLPATQKYVYEGAIDDKTRDICLQMASEGEMTFENIESTYPGAFQDGGGYNCRHRWIPIEAKTTTLLDKSGANQRIESLQSQGKWSTPQTPREQLSG